MEDLHVKYAETISMLDGKPKEAMEKHGHVTRKKLIDIVYDLKDIVNELFILADKNVQENNILENTGNMIVNTCMDVIKKKVHECLPSLIFDNSDPDQHSNKLTFADALKSSASKEIVKSISKDVVSYHNKEKVDSDNRECNLMVFNLKEDPSNEENIQIEADTNVLQNMCGKTLELPNLRFKKVTRVGRKPLRSSSKCRPVKIIFKNVEEKYACLSNAYKLKDAEPELRGLSITHDLTQNQRDELSKLLTEAKNKNELESAKNSQIKWKVRGAPTNLHLVSVRPRME